MYTYRFRTGASGHLVGRTHCITVWPRLSLYILLIHAARSPLCIFIFRHRRRSLVVVVVDGNGGSGLSLMKNSVRTQHTQRWISICVLLCLSCERRVCTTGQTTSRSLYAKKSAPGQEIWFFTMRGAAWLKERDFSFNQIIRSSLGTSSSLGWLLCRRIIIHPGREGVDFVSEFIIALTEILFALLDMIFIFDQKCCQWFMALQPYHVRVCLIKGDPIYTKYR